MILCQEVNSSTELEGEDHEKDSFAYTYAAAACPAAAIATAETTIKEIAVGKQAEAPVKVQQGVTMGNEEYESITIGGGHASLEVLTTVGGKNEFLTWGCQQAKMIGAKNTLQPPAYKFPKPFKSSTQSSSPRFPPSVKMVNQTNQEDQPCGRRTAAGKPREGISPNIHPEIDAHAYTAVSCAATCYAAATVGDMTEGVAMVMPYEVIVGEVQYEFKLRGEGVAKKENNPKNAGKQTPVKDNKLNPGKQCPVEDAAGKEGKLSDVSPTPEHEAAGNTLESGAAGEGQHEEVLMEAVKLKSAEEIKHPVKLEKAVMDNNTPVKLVKAVKEETIDVNPGKQTPGNGAAGKEQHDGDQYDKKTDVEKELLNQKSPGTENPDEEHQIEDLVTNEIDEEDEKNEEAPDAGLAQHTQAMSREGGHALLKPLKDVGGGDMMVTRAEIQAEEHRAVELSNVQSAVKLYYYAKSAAGKYYKTYRNEELPQHRALIMSSHPENSMGEDIVEYPVVFPSRAFPRGTEASTR